MKSFKVFMAEGISKSKISYRDEEDDLISLIMGKSKEKAPYKTSGKQFSDFVIYSSYSFKAND